MTIYVVTSGETTPVSSGAVESGGIVLSGGTLDVLGGGTASNTLIFGSEQVLGVDRAGQLDRGATQTVLSGGVAIDTIVSSGGVQTISGGLAQGTEDLGTVTVLAGGGIIGATVGAGAEGPELVVSGGRAVATILDGGEVMVSGVTSYVYDGSTASTVVLSAAVVSGTVVSAGELDVDFGATATGTVLFGRTSPYVTAGEFVDGGSATGTIVASGAEQTIFGGSADGTVVSGGGMQYLGFGTVATNTEMAASGVVSGFGTLIYTESAGQVVSFKGTLAGSMTVAQDGPGTLALSGTVSGFTGVVEINGGTLDLAAPTALGSAGIDFAPASTGILRIEGSAAPSDTISGFTSGDLIDLAGLGYAGAAAATIDGNTVTITEGSVSETLTITGASTEPLLITSDGGDGTDVQIPCFCSGTRILTDQGEVAVEALAVGDRVITLSGAAQPIIRIGRRAYAGRFLAGRGHLLPVRIRAGALGGGLPRRDLLVSPSHAMFIDALLIPSGQLVNGSSIVQERGWTRVDYVHVELASHTVIWAEGALSETYLDEGDRETFQNAAEYGGRRGTQAVRSCALRVECGFELEFVRKRLAQAG